MRQLPHPGHAEVLRALSGRLCAGPGVPECERLEWSVPAIHAHSVEFRGNTELYYHRLVPSFTEVRYVATLDASLFLEAGRSVL